MPSQPYRASSFGIRWYWFLLAGQFGFMVREYHVISSIDGWCWEVFTAHAATWLVIVMTVRHVWRFSAFRQKSPIAVDQVIDILMLPLNYGFICALCVRILRLQHTNQNQSMTSAMIHSADIWESWALWSVLTLFTRMVDHYARREAVQGKGGDKRRRKENKQRKESDFGFSRLTTPILRQVSSDAPSMDEEAPASSADAGRRRISSVPDMRPITEPLADERTRFASEDLLASQRFSCGKSVSVPNFISDADAGSLLGSPSQLSAEVAHSEGGAGDSPNAAASSLTEPRSPRLPVALWAAACDSPSKVPTTPTRSPAGLPAPRTPTSLPLVRELSGGATPPAQASGSVDAVASPAFAALRPTGLKQLMTPSEDDGTSATSSTAIFASPGLRQELDEAARDKADAGTAFASDREEGAFIVRVARRTETPDALFSFGVGECSRTFHEKGDLLAGEDHEPKPPEMTCVPTNGAAQVNAQMPLTSSATSIPTPAVDAKSSVATLAEGEQTNTADRYLQVVSAFKTLAVSGVQFWVWALLVVNTFEILLKGVFDVYMPTLCFYVGASCSNCATWYSLHVAPAADGVIYVLCSFALIFVLAFENVFRDYLHDIEPWYKFWGVKLVVSVTYFQSFVFSYCAGLTPQEIDLYNCLLCCVEAPLLCILHVTAAYPAGTIDDPAPWVKELLSAEKDHDHPGEIGAQMHWCAGHCANDHGSSWACWVAYGLVAFGSCWLSVNTVDWLVPLSLSENPYMEPLGEWKCGESMETFVARTGHQGHWALPAASKNSQLFLPFCGEKSLRCQAGYEGHPTIKCEPNNTLRPPPSDACMEVGCGSPPMEPHATRTEDYKQFWIKGDSVYYQCVDGFRGAPVFTCTGAGTWTHSPESQPCTIVGCGSLDIFLRTHVGTTWRSIMDMDGAKDENASKMLTESHVGEVVTFACHPGYHGKAVARCMPGTDYANGISNNGRWVLSDACELFKTSNACKCKERWVYCSGWFGTDCREFHGCAPNVSGPLNWCRTLPGSCPSTSQNLWGQEPWADECVNDNFGIQWPDKPVPNVGISSLTIYGMLLFFISAGLAYWCSQCCMQRVAARLSKRVPLLLHTFSVWWYGVQRIPGLTRRWRRIVTWRCQQAYTHYLKAARAHKEQLQEMGSDTMMRCLSWLRGVSRSIFATMSEVEEYVLHVWHNLRQQASRHLQSAIEARAGISDSISEARAAAFNSLSCAADLIERASQRAFDLRASIPHSLPETRTFASLAVESGVREIHGAVSWTRQLSARAVHQTEQWLTSPRLDEGRAASPAQDEMSGRCGAANGQGERLWRTVYRRPVQIFARMQEVAQRHSRSASSSLDAGKRRFASAVCSLRHGDCQGSRGALAEPFLAKPRVGEEEAGQLTVGPPSFRGQARHVSVGPSMACADGEDAEAGEAGCVVIGPPLRREPPKTGGTSHTPSEPSQSHACAEGEAPVVAPNKTADPAQNVVEIPNGAP